MAYRFPHMRRLDAIEATLAIINRKLDKIMATVDTIQADVTAENTVIDSAVTLLQGLSDQLRAAGTDPAKLDALATSIEGKTAQLAAAIVANTPGAPAPQAALQQAQQVISST